MKATAASAIMPVMCVLLALPGMTDGARDRIQVSDGDVKFFIDRYDDGRSLPYVVAFTDFGFKSIYKFNTDGKVIKIKADGDDYNVKYRSNGRIKNVSRVGARRDLAEEVEDGVEPTVEDGLPAPHRRLHPCHECTDAWDDVCFVGVESVCDLVTYGDPFLAPAETSMDVLCSTLGAICEDVSAEEACTGECDECLSPLTITLEWSTDSDGSPAMLDLAVIEPLHSLAYWRYSVGDAGFITSYDNKQVYTVFPDLGDGSSVLGQYYAFAEYYAGSYPVYWTMNAVTGSGEVVFSGEGEFSGECGDSYEFSPESGFDTTKIFYHALNDYVDNGCGVDLTASVATTAAKSARPFGG